ncbi:MAG: hypothetical protein ACE5IL_00735 [Myxococcota bacterium]
MRAEPLRRRLWRRLGSRARGLEVVAHEARRLGTSSFLVGGPVRDLLAGAPIGDLDVLLDGNLEAVARGSARSLGGHVRLHLRFLTARVEAGPLSLDLARARRERYPHPGSLPRVEPATLEDDFARRDFSIHAMALPLEPASGGELLDPFGGARDLRERWLRILHPASFDDDPTRLWRAVRYASRLRLRWTPATLRARRAALARRVLDRVSGDRLARELWRTLEEPRISAALALADRSGVLGATCPGSALRPAAHRALRALEGLRTRPPWPQAAEAETRAACGLRLIWLAAPPSVRREAWRRLGYRGRRSARLEADLAALPGLLRALARRPSDGRVDALLHGLGEPALLALFCAGDRNARSAVRRYACDLRLRASPVDGRRLRALGFRGVALGRALRRARARSLDGRLVDDAWLRRLAPRDS